MKIKVSKLRPNPFRMMDHYPISRTKVEALKVSITETSFWDNLVVRERDGNYELAYGHHRLVALKELGVKEVDLPMRELDDGMMIKIMAGENLSEWKADPAVMMETVRVVRDYLNVEIAKYETWEELKGSDKNISSLFDPPKDKQAMHVWWGKIKNGVGRDTIKAFLGGNWKPWMVQESLDSINEIERGTFVKEALDILPSTSHVRAFKDEIKKSGDKISPTEQVALARKIKKEDPGKRDVRGVIHEHIETITHRTKDVTPKPQVRPHVNDAAKALFSPMGDLESRLVKFRNMMQFIDPVTRDGFTTCLRSLVSVCQQLIQEVKNV